MGWIKRLFGREKKVPESISDFHDIDPKTSEWFYDSPEFLGQTFAGRYHVQGDLSTLYGRDHSGFFLANDIESGDRIILKCYMPSRGSKSLYARYINEIITLGRLNHEGIVRTYPPFVVNNMPILVMEHLPRKCNDYFNGSIEDNEKFCGKIIDFMWELGAVVDYLVSEGVTHRDIKPANLLTDADGKLKLIDFDLAFDRKNEHDVPTTPGMAIGTMAYIPPEGYKGIEPDKKYEVYSVGYLALSFLYNRSNNRELPVSRPVFSGMSHVDMARRILDGTLVGDMMEVAEKDCPEDLLGVIGQSITSDGRLTPDQLMHELSLLKVKYK